MVPRTETPAQSGRACHPTSLRFDRSPCGHPLHAYQQGTFIEKGGWATLPEELIEGMSFPMYRRVATMICVPAQTQRGSIEMVAIDPAALHRDAAAGDIAAQNPKA
jgi:hypothetical protein